MAPMVPMVPMARLAELGGQTQSDSLIESVKHRRRDQVMGAERFGHRDTGE